MGRTKPERPDPAQLHREACERAETLGLVEELLCRAYSDLEWRPSVEFALTKKSLLGGLLRGGAKPTDVWKTSLLRQQVIRALKKDPSAFMSLATTNPRVAAHLADDEPLESAGLDAFEPLDRVLAAHVLAAGDDAAKAAAINAACDVLEARGSSCSEENASDAIADGTEAPNGAPDAAFAAAAAAELKELRAKLAEREKELKTKRKELGVRSQEVGRKERKNQELRVELKQMRDGAAAAAASAVRLKAERDESARELARTKALLESSKSGQKTIEGRRAEEAARTQQALTDLRDRLQTAQEVQEALERRADSLEAELNDERERRSALEETFDAFGIGDLGGSARSLQNALETLSRFHEGIVAYAASQAEKEQQRRVMQEEAARKRQLAEEAKRVQTEAEVSWEVRERERLEECERALYPDGPVDCVIIDGHNLVHRVFRPEDEAKTRPWLERMAEIMAERLESRGWTSQVHLVFDTKYDSNSRVAGHGLRVHFHNNTIEGGADARIAQLLEEGSPEASYMVVSTDRRHVWSETSEFMRAAGAPVDLVQVELMAEYLRALDESSRRTSGASAAT